MSTPPHHDFMTLAHTILTVLSEAPHSGYDLSKRFEESVSCFWKASQQQIYRELSKIETQGWVTYELVPQQGKPDKKLYQITDVGKQELLDWYAQPSTPTPIREDLLVKVLAGPYVPRPLLIQQVKARQALHQKQLDRYLEKEICFQQVEAPEPAMQFRYLTLRRGIRYEQEWIDWCQEVIDTLQADTSKSS